MTSSVAEPLTVFVDSLDSYPGFNRFALDFVRGSGTARRFLCRTDLAALKPAGERRGSDALASALIASNRRWNNDVDAAVEAWRSGRSLALVAGQQVGFGGGPLYTLVKIASLLKLRQQFRQHGIETSLFFWLATEDHDFDEVATLHLWKRDAVTTLRSSHRPRVHEPVGAMTVPPSLIDALRGECPDAPDILLQHGSTFRDAFASLLGEVFKGEGIVLVDSLLPELRREGREVVRSLVSNYEQIQAAVSERSGAIAAAGYTPQVAPSEGGDYSLLFYLDERNERKPLRVSGGRAFIGAKDVSLEEFFPLLEVCPERFSTGALARPLLQDATLGADIFLGGPAEVAYFAQNMPLYERCGVKPAAIALRGHLLVAPERYLRVMRSENIAPGELFLTADEIVARREHASVTEADRRMAQLRATLDQQLDDLARFVASDDRGLVRSIERSRHRINHHLERITARSRSGLARRDHERHRALARLLGTVAPNGTPQDRTIAWLSFWLVYGRRLIDRVVEEVEPDQDRWKVIGV